MTLGFFRPDFFFPTWAKLLRFFQPFNPRIREIPVFKSGFAWLPYLYYCFERLSFTSISSKHHGNCVFPDVFFIFDWFGLWKLSQFQESSQTGVGFSNLDAFSLPGYTDRPQNPYTWFLTFCLSVVRPWKVLRKPQWRDWRKDADPKCVQVACAAPRSRFGLANHQTVGPASFLSSGWQNQSRQRFYRV